MPWETIASVQDCPPGSARECIAGGRIIALFNVDGQFYALDGMCPHQGGPLGKGRLQGCIITCPWHGFQFDVTTGQHQASKSLVHPSFAVRVEGEAVQVDVEP
ncbi:Rieske (2Fe-2S) protein [Anatilimnocola floriformis]|uniref:Rieske (2Fe-2S) protein n=1 Tax=Anatilimnocola floriformis TaxID=2948575 RepID=UPI0020C1CF87|nr:Rieske 2Fe-2S domain-containing protein [Anatilimnocola floriformis]